MSDMQVSTQQLLAVIGRQAVQIEFLEAQNAQLKDGLERIKALGEQAKAGRKTKKVEPDAPTGKE
jgi:hypothetical protein